LHFRVVTVTCEIPVRPDGDVAVGADEIKALEKKTKQPFRPHHSICVPKSVDNQAKFSGGVITTVMLRNIPNKYTQASLLREIDDMGFETTYDFFYLPMDTHYHCNVGYAFINFAAPVYALKFSQIFMGHVFRLVLSPKIARVTPAHIQGFKENVRRFANSAVAHSHFQHYRPVVVFQGQRRDIGEVLAHLQGKREKKTDAKAPGTAPQGPPQDSPQVEAGQMNSNRAGLEVEQVQRLPLGMAIGLWQALQSEPLNGKPIKISPCLPEKPQHDENIFSSARIGLEEAVRKVLRGDDTPPHSSDEFVPGDAEVPSVQLLTPRTHRTHMSGVSL